MKRYRITIQISEYERQAIDKLVWNHNYRSVSDTVRTALRIHLAKERGLGGDSTPRNQELGQPNDRI